MRRSMLIFLLSICVSVISAENSIIFGLSSGIGFSSALSSIEDGSSFGSDYFDDYNAFQSGFVAEFPIAKRMNLITGYEDNKSDFLLSLSYSDKPIGIKYLKKLADSDFEVYVDYQFIEIGFLFKYYLFKHFFYGLGLNKGITISDMSYYSYGDNRYKSYLDLKEDPLSFNFEFGWYTKKSKNISYEMFLNYYQDLENVFPYTYFFEPRQLVDITLNIGITSRI